MLNLIKDIYNFSYITGKFKIRFIAIQNTRVLRSFCKMLTIRMLQNFIQNARWNHAEKPCDLRQITS